MTQTAGRLARPRTASPASAARPRRHEFRCERCSYGAIARIAPERCPMCGGAAWTLVVAAPRARPRLPGTG